jgi:two-component system sensor histidine kinase KdpD
VWATAVVALCVGIDSVLRAAVSESDLVMVFLMGVLVVARIFELGPALWTAVLSVAAFDVLFVEPRYTFAVADTRYLITFAVMGGAGFVLASTTARIRQQAEAESRRAQRVAALYELSRALAGASDDEELARIFTRHVGSALGVTVRVCFGDARDKTGHNLELPLAGAHRRLGTVVIDGLPVVGLSTPKLDLLRAYVQQLTVALERAEAAAAQRRAEVEVEQERMRSSLLSSVSHDLRTPLGTILGATTTLLDGVVSASSQRDLLETIHDEGTRLARLLENLLHMTRIEGGALAVDADWHVPEDVVGAALRTLRTQSEGRRIDVTVQMEPGLVRFDGLLVELALVNVIDNALKHTPPDTPIEIRAHRDDNDYVLEVLDRGPGVPEEERTRMFDKFHRGTNRVQGAGLGLAICRAIARAHDGDAIAGNRTPGPGLCVQLRLPYRSAPPEVRATAS